MCMSVCFVSFTALTVTITAEYNDEETTLTEFTAGNELSLKCEVKGTSGHGSLQYRWYVKGQPDSPPECGRNCAGPIDMFNHSQIDFTPFLNSYHAGTYTCNVSESGNSGSENSSSYTFRVVGMCCFKV